MPKLAMYFIMTFLFAASIFAADWVELKSADTPLTAEVISSDINRTVIKYSVNRYKTGEITIDGKSFTTLPKLNKESMIEEHGYPRLPRINRSIIIPDEGIIDYAIISSNYFEISDIDISPSKGNLVRTIDPETVAYTFGEVYQQNEFFPPELVNIRESYILRDYRGVVVELNAFRYNPVKRILRIYTDIIIEVKRTGPGGENVLVRNQPLTRIDPQFAKIYQRRFINYSGLDYPTLLESGGMLIICHDDFMMWMNDFVDWKIQKGIHTEMVPASEVGSTADQIKNYIRDYYYANDLAYVLLVGDNPQIPTFNDGSDPVYSLIEGGDSYPDIFVGRFSAEDRGDVETQVERTITYEKYPDPTLDWYHHGLGDADESGPTNDEQYDFQHITHIAERLVRWNYSQVDSVYTTFSGTTQMIVDFMNAGVSIFNYAGHGWINMVGPVNFTSTNANALVNDNKLFHMVAVACQPGNFVNQTCLSEDLLRATNNTTGEPTGAIAVYLSKISQSWFPPYDMQDEGVDLIAADSMLTFGGMCFNGSMFMIDLHGGGGISEFRAWTIFGDPSVCLRSSSPYELNVVHNPQLPVGIGTLEVSVSAFGGPLEGAMVCGMNDEVYATAITNASGQAALIFDPPPYDPGSLTLTVTHGNPIPYIAEVDIIPMTGPYVVYDSSYVQDDIVGNDNGQLDYAETVELGMTVKNVGLLDASNVSGILISDDPLVTITQNSAVFGEVPAGSSLNLERAFEFEVAPEVSDGYPVSFALQTTDGIDTWESMFSVTAHAPEVVFAGLIIDDSAGGNNNGCLDPGETADLQVSLINNGSSSLDDVEAALSTVSPYVVINTAQANYTTLEPGEQGTGVYNLSIDPGCPQEYNLEFDMDITGASGYVNSTGFVTVVGDIICLPTGPDSYGYSAYESHDLPELPDYEWIEISPDSGGSGTLVPFVNDDEYFHFPLPFDFQYYGEQFDSITISSNGWLGMGVVNEEDYSNSGIPDVDGPSPMVAPYWEDMSPQRANSGGVWVYYDDSEHLYIIEFNHVEQFSPTGNFETFQTILYDPAHHPTISGDGRIKIQYKAMSVTAQDEGTIGIENPAETDGIEILYDGDYDVHADIIAPESVILFTTPTSIPDITITLTPTFDPIIIAPIGGNFEFNLLIENTGSSALTFDGWFDVMLPDSSLYGPVLLREALTLNPGGTISRTMNQYVPGAAPAGEYEYYGKVGIHPNTVYAFDSFPFEKLAGDGTGSSYTGWTLTGWDEPVDAASDLPTTYSLSQNYPNPFNPETTIRYTLPEASQVKISVFNIRGQEVAQLVDGYIDAGYHSAVWHAVDIPSGIYFYQIEAGDFKQTRKMVLLK